MLLFLFLFVFFFFKQKTAYEMRISDWSSDVCSSDLGQDVELHPGLARDLAQRRRQRGVTAEAQTQDASGHFGERRQFAGGFLRKCLVDEAFGRREIGRASCRERVCQYV